jgi:hypothetical protein
MKNKENSRRRRVIWRGEENPAEEDRTFISADSRYFQNGGDNILVFLQADQRVTPSIGGNDFVPVGYNPTRVTVFVAICHFVCIFIQP